MNAAGAVACKSCIMLIQCMIWKKLNCLLVYWWHL